MTKPRREETGERLMRWARQPADLRSPSGSAMVVAALYAVVGGAWIIVSDHLLLSLDPTPDAYARLQTLKGWGFVAITALALFVLLRSSFRRRRHAVEAVQEVTDQLLHHVESTPLVLVEWDRRFRVTRWSHSAEGLFGWTEEEALGRTWLEWELVHPDERESTERFLSRLPLSDPGGTIHVQRNVTKDGRELWCEWYTSWRRDREGHLVLLSLVHDITADRQAMDEVQRVSLDQELQLTRRTRELAQANRDLRAFTRSVSKDLREPVKSVINFAEKLRDEFAGELPDQARRNLIYILAAGRHMDHLIEDLLEYATVGSGEVSRVPVDLHEVTRNVVAELEERFPEASSAVSLPRSAVTVAADPILVERVLTHLVDNALKYRDQTRPARVDVSAEREGDEVVVRVRDNGPGIPDAQKEKIFDIFHRLHGQESHPGTGTGLAIVRKAMGLMGGTVRAMDHSGPGVTFVLRFPVHDVLQEMRDGGRRSEDTESRQESDAPVTPSPQPRGPEASTSRASAP
jgi:PAS domain S-box-containing protein